MKFPSDFTGNAHKFSPGICRFGPLCQPHLDEAEHRAARPAGRYLLNWPGCNKDVERTNRSRHDMTTGSSGRFLEETDALRKTPEGHIRRAYLSNLVSLVDNAFTLIIYVIGCVQQRLQSNLLGWAWVDNLGSAALAKVP